MNMLRFRQPSPIRPTNLAVAFFWELTLTFLTLHGAGVAQVSGPDGSPKLPSPSTTAAQPLEFDVVSIKENPGPNYEFMGTFDEPDGVHAIVSLHGLLADAYGVRREFIVCKLPLCEKPVFEIRAKVAEEDQTRFGKLTYQEKASLLEPVLKERFGLEVHTETRLTNVYDLVLAKGGSRLKAPPAEKPAGNSGTRGPDGVVWIMPSHFRGFAITLDTFVPVLSQFVGDALGRAVVNKTGLTGTYDIELTWTDNLHSPDHAPGATSANTENTGPGIFAALPEQLGLELKPAKEPIPPLILDEAHLPTPN